MVMVISVYEVCGAASTSAEGEALHAAMVNGLRGDDGIAISFANVRTATSSFVNSSLVALLADFEMTEIRRRVDILDSTHQINDMIRRCLKQETQIAT